MAQEPRLGNLADFPDPILVVTAHPDDTEVHCGGTLAQLVAAGRQVTCVLCTSTSRRAVTPRTTTGVMERIARENGARVDVPMAEAFRVLRPT